MTGLLSNVLYIISSAIYDGAELSADPNVFSHRDHYVKPLRILICNSLLAVDKLICSVHSFVKFIIYDIPGKAISSLVNRDLNRGSYEVNWFAGEFPSGTYFYKLEAINNDKGKLQFTEIRRMILIK